jgi:hypothetical protein
VSAHLRELSLSVLPQPADDDDGFDTDDSDPSSSAPGSERIGPKTDVEREIIPQEDPDIVRIKTQRWQSLPPLSPISSITSSNPTIPDEQYGLGYPGGTAALTAEPEPTTDASATNKQDALGAEKSKSTSGAASASTIASQAAAGSASIPDDVDLDGIIDRLLEVRGSRPGKQVQLLESEIRYLCTKAREIFISQPILLELEGPMTVG